jgi:hypothetical protein
MTTEEVIEAILLAVSKHIGDTNELYDRLSDLGCVWVDRFNELIDEHED